MSEMSLLDELRMKGTGGGEVYDKPVLTGAIRKAVAEIERLTALAARPDREGELAKCHERINMVDDMLGDVLGYLEGDSPNAKPGLIVELKAYFEHRKTGRGFLVHPATSEQR